MSAANGLLQKQKKTVHVISDGLAYIDDLPIDVEFIKTEIIDGMTAVVSGTGPATFPSFVAFHIPHHFVSFDALIAGAEPFLRQLFETFIEKYCDGDAVAMLLIAGWHEKAQKPGLYSMMLRTDGEQWARIRRNSQGETPSENFKLSAQEVVSFPCPTLAQFQAAGFDVLYDLETSDPETVLLHGLEIQRRISFGGKHSIGGHAFLTTIDETGCHQRIIHTWDEDRIGEVIRPKPIDWKGWLAKRRASSAGLNFEGMSRLQRERMHKKAAKGTLRVVK